MCERTLTKKHYAVFSCRKNTHRRITVTLSGTMTGTTRRAAAVEDEGRPASTVLTTATRTRPPTWTGTGSAFRKVTFLVMTKAFASVTYGCLRGGADEKFWKRNMFQKVLSKIGEWVLVFWVEFDKTRGSYLWGSDQKLYKNSSEECRSWGGLWVRWFKGV